MFNPVTNPVSNPKKSSNPVIDDATPELAQELAKELTKKLGGNTVNGMGPGESSSDPFTINAHSEQTRSEGFLGTGLDIALIATLNELGYEEPTPIQKLAIPILLQGNDIIGQAATGTGKTAAFSLPLIQRIAALGKGRPAPSALVLVPTRELAIQVAEAVHEYGHKLGIRSVPIYGGQGYDQQLRALRKGVDIVIATPGRALDHIRQNTLKLNQISTFVLDEADEMLNMGFLDDIDAIFKLLPETRQVVLFSATLPPRIATVAKRYMKNPQRVSIAQEPLKPGTLPKVLQKAYVVQRSQKRLALSRLLDIESPTSAIVFCRTRTEVDELTEGLLGGGFRVAALHGGMSQSQRERVIKRLKDGSNNLVIATDVAARGLDIDQLSHVVNFDVPSAPEAYVHRIGRVGRAGREGVALTLVEPREQRQLRIIEQITKTKITVASVPSLADLQSRRLEQTKETIREVLVSGQLESFDSVILSLTDEFSLRDIALAGIKLARKSFGNPKEEEQEILAVKPSPKGNSEGRRSSPQGASRETLDGPTARMYLGVGRSSGTRPQDIVGAITGEAGIAGREIGGIEIMENFSIVEIPQNKLEQIIDTMSKVMIKGKKTGARVFHNDRVDRNAGNDDRKDRKSHHSSSSLTHREKKSTRY